MANDILSGSLGVEWIETTDEPFIPKGTSIVFANLTPLQQQQNTYYPPGYLEFFNSLKAPFIPKYGELPEFEDVQKELIINIETTRVKPWEGLMFCIGVLDPNTLEPAAMNFIEETEEKTLDAFLTWFAETEYSTLVGYNVSFDHRFLYVLMQKYRKEVPRWIDIDLYDLMQQQEQVKDKFVPGRNPSGKLEDWGTYLFGSQPYAKQEQVWKWNKEGNIEEIINFNSDKLTKAYFLWVLNKVVGGTILTGGETGKSETPELEGAGHAATPKTMDPENVINVPCPNCHQRQDMLKTDKVINCEVCAKPIANPGL